MLGSVADVYVEVSLSARHTRESSKVTLVIPDFALEGKIGSEDVMCIATNVRLSFVHPRQETRRERRRRPAQLCLHHYSKS